MTPRDFRTCIAGRFAVLPAYHRKGQNTINSSKIFVPFDVEMDPDGSIKLLPAGAAIAEGIYERHRTLTDFFVYLGVRRLPTPLSLIPRTAARCARWMSLPSDCSFHRKKPGRPISGQPDNIAAAIVVGDKAVALLRVKPFHSSRNHWEASSPSRRASGPMCAASRPCPPCARCFRAVPWTNWRGPLPLVGEAVEAAAGLQPSADGALEVQLAAVSAPSPTQRPSTSPGPHGPCWRPAVRRGRSSGSTPSRRNSENWSMDPDTSHSSTSRRRVRRLRL